jgi:hypothetical protein
MITSSSLKRTAKVAALTVAVSASGSAVALAGTGGSTTSGNNSILGGNQISVPVSIPLDVCGNALALLGDAFGGCRGGASVTGGQGNSNETTAGNNSILGGNQISVPISAPVNVCGNSAAGLGTSASGCRGGATVAGGPGGSNKTTSGNNSIGGGNQISVPVRVPINVCGNSLAILGLALSGCKGGSSAGSPPPGHHRRHPSHWHIQQVPPPRHRHHHPPAAHHGGSGQPTPGTALTAAGSLPTTGANFLGLLALAGGVLAGGAGCVLAAARRGLLQGVLAGTRRAARSLAASTR